MAKNKLSRISKADSLEKMGEFWDTHDFTEFDDLEAPDVEFNISCAVPIEIDLLTSVEKQAKRRGVKTETLVNLWLQEKLAEETQSVLADEK
ncbi:MAG: BrnA antitoxin family protein [candidate division KSB1 bacterium]|nr:BrnA antitoxin family protein [candidate division KSB1 bacterium]